MNFQIIFFIYLCLLFSGCNSLGIKNEVEISKDSLISTEKFNENTNYSDVEVLPSKIEMKIYDTIFSIPEVKNLSNYLEKQENASQHLRIWIYLSPHENEGKNYWVKVGEENPINFVTYYNFFLDSSSFEIKFFDASLDSCIPIYNWRARRMGSKILPK